LWRGATIQISPEPQPFDKGLIFVKEADILLSGDKWTIAVNIAIDDYVSLVKTLRLVLGQIRRNIQVHNEPNTAIFDIHWEEITRLDTLNQELTNDVNSFRQLLFIDKLNKNATVQKLHTKRGLINMD
jgi:hypothetical protein